MTIGFDGSRIAKQFHTGTEYYSTEILKNLGKIDYKNQYIIYSPKPIDDRVGKLPKNFRYRIIPFPKLWTQFRLSWEMAFSQKPDILFIPSHTIPWVHPHKTIVTVHDLGFKYFPELYGRAELIYQDFALQMAVKKASHIITVSQNTKKDLISLCKIHSDKITVVYNGYNNVLYRPKKTNDKISEKISKHLPYIFFIGRLEKKKNILGMLRAYQLLRQEKNITHKLVLAGKRGYGYEEFGAEKKKLPKNIQNDIIELGYVTEQDIAEWMKNAEIFFFPTFFEGFGIPVLEAMACNVPVVTSNNTSIPEITGSAALLIDPHKPLEMAAALSKVIHSETLKKSLQSKGLVRASMFSWEKAAEKTLKVLLKK
jgi:glycosyltransferase involved in cell wall biosynthesis